MSAAAVSPRAILGSLVLAVVAGLILTPETRWFGVVVPHAVLETVGGLFLDALFVLVVPLVVSALVSGIAGIGAGQGLGRLGLRTVAYYLVSGAVAVLVALTAVNLVQPGLSGGEPVAAALGLDAETAEVGQSLRADGDEAWSLLDRLIPENIFAAAAEGQLLGLIVFALVLGLAIARMGEGAATLRAFWDELFAVMMRITGWVLRLAPIGVFALVASTVAETGLEAFASLAVFFATVLGALLFHGLVVLPLVLWWTTGIDPRRHLRNLAPVLLTAFSTASSSGTLPLTLNRVEQGAGVSNRTSSVVLPLGATVNMDGTALYECAAVLFIAQAYGLDLGLAEQALVVVMALATSIGVAGVPAASLVAITLILSSVGLPLEGVGLLLAVDRVLDMTRTAVNVFSDATGAVILARWEGERPYSEGTAPAETGAGA